MSFTPNPNWKQSLLALAVVSVTLPCAAQNLGGAGDFAVLGLAGGAVTINSGKLLVGDLGYSADVYSVKNQKVKDLQGDAYVDSTADFDYTAKNFAPDDIFYGADDAAVDTKLDGANADALAASACFAGLTPDIDLGDVTGDVVIPSDGRNVTVVNVNSVDVKEATLTFQGDPGQASNFIVNVTGNSPVAPGEGAYLDFDFASSTVEVVNTGARRIVWNFTNTDPTDLQYAKIYKKESVFKGTILAPLGGMEYHNPGSFLGAIVASEINLHSDFNLEHRSLRNLPVTCP